MLRKGMINFKLMLVVIVGLVTLLVFLLLVFKIGAGAEDQAYKTRCKASVTAYSKLNSLPFGDATSDAGNIECPTKFTTVAGKSSIGMKREIANMMYECWNNYGEGRLLLFRASSEKFCGLCNVFQFEDKTARVDHFTSFLMSERIPVRNKDGYSPTYYDYIAGTDTGTVIPDPNSPADMSYLDGSKRYVVAFTYYKESWWYRLRNGLIAGAITAVGVGAATAIAVFTAGIGTPVALAIIGGSVAVAGGVAGGTAAAGTSSADWEANIVLAEYNPEMVQRIGCEELPVSMVDARFR